MLSELYFVAANRDWRRARRWLAMPLLALAAAGQAATLFDYPFQNSAISTCRIDLRHDALRTFWKDDAGQVLGKFGRLRDWLREHGRELVCASNAGIYEEDYRPLGLYIENGVLLRKLNTRKGAYGNFYMQPNGVLLLHAQHARIVDTDRFAAERETLAGGVLYATQSGPLLLQDGRINPHFAEWSGNRLIRNAVCTVSPSEVVLAVSKGPVSFRDFAQFLRDELGCVDALYLDGSVSRMYPGANSEVGPMFGPLLGVVK